MLNARLNRLRAISLPYTATFGGLLHTIYESRVHRVYIVSGNGNGNGNGVCKGEEPLGLITLSDVLQALRST